MDKNLTKFRRQSVKYYKEDSSKAGTELFGSTISLPYKKEGYIIELRGNDGVTIIQQAYLNCKIDPDA